MPDLKTNLKYLNSFASVDTDWSGNPMKSVSASVLNLADYILHHLSVQPVLNLTGRSTVQMEWHKSGGEYFEIEIFEDQIYVIGKSKDCANLDCWHFKSFRADSDSYQFDSFFADCFVFSYSSADAICYLADKFTESCKFQ